MGFVGFFWAGSAFFAGWGGCIRVLAWAVNMLVCNCARTPDFGSTHRWDSRSGLPLDRCRRLRKGEHNCRLAKSVTSFSTSIGLSKLVTVSGREERVARREELSAWVSSEIEEGVV